MGGGGRSKRPDLWLIDGLPRRLRRSLSIIYQVGCLGHLCRGDACLLQVLREATRLVAQGRSTHGAIEVVVVVHMRGIKAEPVTQPSPSHGSRRPRSRSIRRCQCTGTPLAQHDENRDFRVAGRVRRSVTRAPDLRSQQRSIRTVRLRSSCHRRRASPMPRAGSARQRQPWSPAMGSGQAMPPFHGV